MEQSMWAHSEGDGAHGTPARQPAPIHAQDPLSVIEAPIRHDAAIDTFAQTGAQQDDLFDDVVPAPESMRLRSDDDLFSDDFTPAPQLVVESAAPHEAPVETGRARGRGRGRARGHRDGRDGHARLDSPAQVRGGAGAGAREGESSRNSNTKLQPQAHPQRQAPENAPLGPRRNTAQSVRGDRQVAGGLRRPKLTEAELAEKMASIQIKNASLTAAHARAEADAASFAEREQHAKSLAERRRKEEVRDRQQMMGEREKNRLRKLKAQGGREWDAEKQEKDFDKGARHDKPGGFAGDQQDYNDGREYLYREPKGVQRGHGNHKSNHGGQGPVQVVPRQDEFPALPSEDSIRASKINTTLPVTAAMKSSDTSWADQVESSEAL